MAKRNKAEPFNLFSASEEADPSILLDLAPFIPAYLLPRAVQVASGIPYPDLYLRAATVKSLAERLKNEDETLIKETLLAARRVLLETGEVEPALLLTLAPILPSHLIPEALELAVRIVNYDVRTDILASLAARLSPSDRESVLSSALDAVSSLEFEYHKTDALIILTLHLPASLPLLEKAAGIARSLPDRKLRVKALTALVYSFQGNEDVNDYISKIRNSDIRSKAIAEPEDIFPGSFMESAQIIVPEDRTKEDKLELESILQLPQFYLNLTHLVRLGKKLPEKERSAIIPKMLNTARSIESKITQARSLIAIIKLIPPKDRKELVDEALNLISSVENPEEHAQLSSELIPLLPVIQQEQMLPEILSLTRTLKDEVSKLIILEDLIPILPESSINDVLEIIDSLKDPRYRTEALIKAAAYFPAPSLYKQMEKTMEAIASADFRERSWLIEIFSPCLPRYLLLKALEISRRIRDRQCRADASSSALASLARLAHGVEKEEILREALKEAFFKSFPHGGRGGRSDPIGINVSGQKAKKLLRTLPADQRESLLKEWLGPVEKIPESTGDDFKRAIKGPMSGGILRGGPLKRKEAEVRTEPLLPPQERVVNTGFSEREHPGLSLKETPLKNGGRYYFWLDIGELDIYSIEKIPIPVPVEHLPSEASLKVALFSFENEIEITEGEDVGELKLLTDGSAKVKKQPVKQTDQLPDDLADKRLFFPVRAPSESGISKLRCNIYYEQILVQARLIRALVTERPEPVHDALTSVVDYTLSHTLWPAHLNRLDPHRLSLMLNTNGDKTHALIFGQKGNTLFKEAAVLSASELKTPVTNARKALRKVSWGDPDPWSGQQYKYSDQKLNVDRLRKDIINLAINGYVLYNALIDKLSGGRKESYQLADLMLSPGMVQIALKQSPSQVIPAALFYDYPLDTQSTHHKLCDDFISALQNKKPLEETTCFNGACPSYDNLDYVCPSGFWGYRHFLGTPVTVGDQTGEEI